MIKLTLEDLSGLKLDPQDAKVGVVFETDMLDCFRGVYRIAEVTSRGVQAERIRWVPTAGNPQGSAER